MSGMLTYAGFRLNQAYISRVLCLNRDKPQMQCKGQCYLTKKLKEAEKHPQTSTKKGWHEELNVFFQPQSAVVAPVSSTFVVHLPLTPYRNDYRLVFEAKIFHPPSC
jgi:hypothetical protein